jgi:hypothetical protein
VSRLGPLDTDLSAANFIVPPNLMLRLASLAMGVDDDNSAGMIQSHAKQFIFDQFKRLGFGSFFGEKEVAEVRTVDRLRVVSESNLIAGKQAFLGLIKMLSGVAELSKIIQSDQRDKVSIAFEKTAFSFGHPQWIVSMLAALVIINNQAELDDERR